MPPTNPMPTNPWGNPSFLDMDVLQAAQQTEMNTGPVPSPPIHEDVNPVAWVPGYARERPASDAHIEMNITTTPLEKIIQYRTFPTSGFPIVGASFDSLIQLYGTRSIEKIPSVNYRVPPLDIRTVFGKEVNPNIGIEIELEGMLVNTAAPFLNADSVSLGSLQALRAVWGNKEDSSLKNNGVEYFTKLGVKASDAPQALALLNLYLKGYYNRVEVNYRCGTHVHLDVRKLSVEHFINLILVYMLYENSLFAISGARQKSIFCVPLRAAYTGVEQALKVAHKTKPTYEDFRKIFKSFKKYMAFNLLPAGPNRYSAEPGAGFDERKTFGTVEFRHHKGETNPWVLCRWIQALLDIYSFAVSKSFEELKETIFNLNTASNYLALVDETFSRPLQGLTSQELVDDMYEGSSYIKELYLLSKGA